MPDGSVDIYIESSFFSVASGTQDASVSFLTKEADNIGLRDTFVKFFSELTTAGVVGSPVEVFTSYSGAKQDGFISTATRYETETVGSGMAVSLVDYSIPTTTSGLQRTDDAEFEYYTGTTKISGALDFKNIFTGGQLYIYSDNILGYYHTVVSDTLNDDYEHYYTAGGHYDPLIPGPPEDQVVVSGTGDFFQRFTMGSLLPGGTIQEECELFLAGYPMEFHPEQYTYRFHLLAGLEGSKQAAEWETTVISGAVIDLPIDLYSTATTSGYYKHDAVCGHTSYSGIDFPVSLVSYSLESEIISGTIGYIDHKVICSVSGTGGYKFDINLLSLKISNFSLSVDEYTFSSGQICVDITDDVYNVVTSGSHFIIDETVTSGNTYTPITDGYRMCYDSPTDFESLVGSTTVTVHTENDNGDILEQDFYLTSGYIVEYDNRTQDYGFGSQVVVRGTAENMASCPDTGTAAYFFTTEPKESKDLGAAIVCRPWGEKDLSAEIAPQTETIYFYGKVFRIEVRAKDFAGNVMEPFTFEFRIEDKPE